MTEAPTRVFDTLTGVFKSINRRGSLPMPSSIPFALPRRWPGPEPLNLQAREYSRVSNNETGRPSWPLANVGAANAPPDRVVSREERLKIEKAIIE